MIIAVEGRKYEGKTTLAFYIAMKLRRENFAYPVMIFDPKWSFREPQVFVDGHPRKIKFAETPDAFEDAIEHPEDAVTYRPRISISEDDESLIWSEFTTFCNTLGLADLLRNPPSRPIILLIDEAEYLQGGRSMHPALSSAIRLATKDKLFIILACHGPRELVPTVRRQIDEFYFFRLDDPADLAYVRERCGQQVMDAVSNLPQHHFIHFASKTRQAMLHNRPDVWKATTNERNISVA